MDAIIAAFFFAIAAGATYCARLTRADRSYWPMLRIIWSLLVLAYGGSGLALVLGRGRIAPATRLIAAGAVLAWKGASPRASSWETCWSWRSMRLSWAFWT
jgi:hypothetical protein